jgi:hypothetical protein
LPLDWPFLTSAKLADVETPMDMEKKARLQKIIDETIVPMLPLLKEQGIGFNMETVAKYDLQIPGEK